MCGIVGLIKLQTTYGTKHKAMFQDMLYADVVRGHHSTGAFKVNNGEVDWRKAAVPAWEFFGLNGVAPFFNNLGDSSFLCGHNRFGTRGANTDGNAHPFEIKLLKGNGTITLVHNGTVSMWNLPGKFDVDSQAVTNAIAVLGPEEASKKLDGAYSLVWYNSENKTLNFMRNKERPMWFAHHKDFILYGSEQGLLKWVGGRHGFEFDKVESTEIHKLYTFKEGVGEPVITTVEPYRFQYSTTAWPKKHYPRYGSEFGWDMGEDSDEAWDNGQTKIHPTTTPIKVNTPAEQDCKINHQPRSLQMRQTLNRVKDRYKIGTLIYFSVDDYLENTDEKFTTVTGDCPECPHLLVKGNFGGSVDALASTKNLLSGIVSQVSILKHEDKVMLFLKDIVISDRLDPFFLPKEKPVATAVKQVVDANKCSDCDKFFPFGERGFVMQSGGMWKCLCLNCRNVALIHDVVTDQRLAH